MCAEPIMTAYVDVELNTNKIDRELNGLKSKVRGSTGVIKNDFKSLQTSANGFSKQLSNLTSLAGKLNLPFAGVLKTLNGMVQTMEKANRLTKGLGISGNVTIGGTNKLAGAGQIIGSQVAGTAVEAAVIANSSHIINESIRNAKLTVVRGGKFGRTQHINLPNPSYKGLMRGIGGSSPSPESPPGGNYKGLMRGIGGSAGNAGFALNLFSKEAWKGSAFASMGKGFGSLFAGLRTMFASLLRLAPMIAAIAAIITSIVAALKFVSESLKKAYIASSELQFVGRKMHDGFKKLGSVWKKATDWIGDSIAILIKLSRGKSLEQARKEIRDPNLYTGYKRNKDPFIPLRNDTSSPDALQARMERYRERMELVPPSRNDSTSPDALQARAEIRRQQILDTYNLKMSTDKALRDLQKERSRVQLFEKSQEGFLIPQDFRASTGLTDAQGLLQAVTGGAVDFEKEQRDLQKEQLDKIDELIDINERIADIMSEASQQWMQINFATGTMAQEILAAQAGG